MRFIRAQMRAHRQNLTVPQFRTLVVLSQDVELSMSDLAEHLGISVPAASRMVDGLVRRGLLHREARPSDRRSVSLSLTDAGHRTFRAALRATERRMTERFKELSDAEMAQVTGAMETLAEVFAPAKTAAKIARGVMA